MCPAYNLSVFVPCLSDSHLSLLRATGCSVFLLKTLIKPVISQVLSAKVANTSLAICANSPLDASVLFFCPPQTVGLKHLLERSPSTLLFKRSLLCTLYASCYILLELGRRISKPAKNPKNLSYYIFFSLSFFLVKMRIFSETGLHQVIPPTSTLLSSHEPIEGDAHISYDYETLPPGILSLSNKKCAHAVTHDCPYLADSNCSLCTACAYAVANGQTCS